ncbi:MAG: pyridoxal phosphate-dependent aminotransferase [Bacteroidota bacterium]|jgi:aspartate aminotransferase|nr:pyridoxal phosphate-dependent aminotransferase [Bacteroidota bacterium]
MTPAPQLSQRAAIMPASPIRKLVPLGDAAKKRGTHVYHLNIGQPDIETPPEFLDAVRGYQEKVIAYGNSQGIRLFIESMQEYYASLAIPLAYEDIVITTGGSEAIMFAMMAVAQPGDEILVFEPFYTNYNGFAIMAGVSLVPIATEAADGFHLPAAEVIAAHITPRTRAMIICNPNNPTGTVLRDDELDMVRDLALAHNLYVLSDEVYREFVYEGTARSVLRIEGLEQHAIVLDSLSKRYSLCGGRMGAVISRNRAFMDVMVRFGQARLCAATLEQVGAAALVAAGARYFAPMIDEYRQRRDATYDALQRIPGILCRKPSGAFYIMAQFPVDDIERFAAWMLTDFQHDGETTMLAPGPGFYATPGRGMQEARLAYVLNAPECTRAIDLVARGIDAYNSLNRKD